ncbi:MltG/YceG/YrrL family protein [Brevibacillus migulae]|uniref:DNA polymerase III subunit gamma/tau n=1 Tax=Brevibacillus migulae TaxID=1644114 RepID=UPI00106E6568|nr:DNA polymerase III subunit gamma/tau [Brevibacillus migulae]
MKRNLLMGFGAGLVFAAGFMIVFPPQGKSAVMTKEQLQSAAQAYDMVLVSKQEYEKWKEKEESGNKGKAPTAPAKPVSPTAPKQGTGQAPAAPKTPAEGTTPTTPAAPAQQAPAAPAAPADKVSFTVTAGMTSANVAAQLVKAGVLPPNNQFVRKLRDQNKLNRIRTGTYSLEKGMSEDDVIKLLTTPPRL